MRLSSPKPSAIQSAIAWVHSAHTMELPTGSILTSLGQKQAKKVFDGKLGDYLREAPNDDWDVNPRSCALKHWNIYWK